MLRYFGELRLVIFGNSSLDYSRSALLLLLIVFIF